MIPSDLPSPEFLEAFRANAGANGVMDFARFMELALYDPALGYYRRRRPRVGYGPATDYFTASTSGPVFGELVVAACATLLGADAPASAEFVEIGAERPGGVLAGVKHPFASARTVAAGEPIALAGRCVVFSNELFDAQPFRRFVRRGRHWRELGVRAAGDRLQETEMDGVVPAVLPTDAAEGCLIDAPLAAAELAAAIAAQPWSGLFVGCDYGKSWAELSAHCPNGTARAYHRHRQSNELLARPGEQDLTCHVCWDWMQAALAQRGFAAPQLESQELFFVRHATRYIASASEEDAARFSQRKLSLAQLLHPGHLGQKFQVLHARR